MIKLPDYKILKKIGSGGMGDVYLAEHKVLETSVAIKSLHNNLVKDETFRKRFKTEAKIHAKLYHPNVVKLIDFQEREDGLFIIMEYVKGQQLDDYIKNESGPIPEKELISLFSQILDAISHAHSKGLVHRDIKPANVIISDGKIKVLDFGIAKELSSESGLTKTGVQVGTPMYMSPEQVNAEPLDNLTDIYSLGVTLFYMAVGQVPYQDSNAMKMGIQIVTKPFPKAKKFYPAVSDKIELIIKKATEKTKVDRYQSCEEFKKDLISSKKPISPQTKTSKPKQPTKKNKLYPVLIIFLIAVAGFFYYQNNLNLKEVISTDVKEKIPKTEVDSDPLRLKERENTKKKAEAEVNSDPLRVIEREKVKKKAEATRKAKAKKKAEAAKKAKAKKKAEAEVNSDPLRVIEREKAKKKAEVARKAKAKKKADAERKAEAERKSEATKQWEERKARAEREAEEKRKSENIKKSVVNGSIKPEIFYRAAEKERNNQDFKAAIKTYSKAIKANSNYAEAYYKRGVCHVKLGNYQAALDDFTKNIDLNSNNANAYRDRAVCKRLMGNWDFCDDYKIACNLGNLRSCSDYESCK